MNFVIHPFSEIRSQDFEREGFRVGPKSRFSVCLGSSALSGNEADARRRYWPKVAPVRT